VKRKKESLVDHLLDSYAEVGGINHIDGVNLPSKGAVAEMTQILLHLLFPGFYENGCLTQKSMEAATVRQLKKVRTRLVCELEKSIEYRPIQPSGPGSSAALAKKLADDFLGRLPGIREKVSTDVEAAYEGDPAATSFEEIILAYPGLEAIAVQRLAHELHLMGVALIPRMMTEWAHARTGIDIHPGAVIGSHFFIDHGTGVVIGETCVIGDHVKVYHGVTLGARSTSGGQTLRNVKRHPTIEDHVTIYPGATILGGETVIGDNSTIGGNVFLMHGVPPQSLVYYEERSVVIRSKRDAMADSWSI
jgi:serine O-acetyltransferase